MFHFMQTTTAQEKKLPTFQIPARIWKFFIQVWRDEEVAVKEITQATILDLVRQGKITTMRAASLLGLEWEDFLKVMKEHQVPYFNLTPEELQQDLEDQETVFEKAMVKV